MREAGPSDGELSLHGVRGAPSVGGECIEEGMWVCGHLATYEEGLLAWVADIGPCSAAPLG